MSTHPDIVLNNDRCRLRTFVGSAACLIIHRMSICVGYQYTSTNLYIVTNCNTVVNPDACAAHAHIIANGKLSSLFYIHSTLQIARHWVHRIARGEVEVISYFQLTPPISQDTLPGIWRFLPNATPCAFSIMRLMRGYSLMRRVVGRLRSFIRNCFIISNIFPQLHHQFYHRRHIIILILSQSTAEHYIFLVCSQLAILFCKLVIAFVVHWVVWLHAVFILC